MYSIPYPSCTISNEQYFCLGIHRKRLSEAAVKITEVLEEHSLSIFEAMKVLDAVSQSVKGQECKAARETLIVSVSMDVRPA